MGFFDFLKPKKKEEIAIRNNVLTLSVDGENHIENPTLQQIEEAILEVINKHSEFVILELDCYFIQYAGLAVEFKANEDTLLKTKQEDLQKKQVVNLFALFKHNPNSVTDDIEWEDINI